MYFILLFWFSSLFGEHYFLGIAGTGRCGTKYTSQVLRNMGLDCPHESLGRNGIVSLYLPGKKYPYSFHDHHRTGKDLTFTHLFLQVRHPLKVIASFNQHFNHVDLFWKFMCEEIPEIYPTDPLIVKASKYWLYWNLKAMRMAEWIYKIEEFDSVFEEFCERLNVPVNRQALANVDPHTNHFGPVRELSWKKLHAMLQAEGQEEIFNKIQALAHRYSYSTTD